MIKNKEMRLFSRPGTAHTRRDAVQRLTWRMHPRFFFLLVVDMVDAVHGAIRNRARRPATSCSWLNTLRFVNCQRAAHGAEFYKES